MTQTDPFRCPNIPLASGQVIKLPSGDLAEISRVDLQVTTSTGETVTVALEPEHGGWWPPQAG
jgi:hypothetical protein